MQKDNQSANSPGQDSRLELIKQWIETELGIAEYSIETASADASFRRYFRLSVNDNSWIIMDAPPDREDCEPFVKIAR